MRGGTSGSLARLQTCMYVCLRALSMYVCMSDRPKQVCMYVWGSWASVYVCLTQSYKMSLFRGVSSSLSKAFKICRLIHFFWIVRRSTSGSLARVQTCMYVCLKGLSMYVCMSDRPKKVCMYVWGSWACMYVCLTQSYKISLFQRVSNSFSKPFKI